MEEKKLNFVRNGVTKLPPGFRFEPTDEEVLFQYLKCKVFGLPLPAFIIPEINVCHFDPWNLPGDPEQDKYFFSKMSEPNLNATSSSGYWKPTGENRLIISSATPDHCLVGLRKAMVFHKGMSSGENAPTNWTMHEYSLIFKCHSSAYGKSLSPCFLTMKDQWTICHILKKNTPSHNHSITRKKRAREANSVGGLKLSKLDNGAKTTSSPSPSSSSSSSSTLTEK